MKVRNSMVVDDSFLSAFEGLLKIEMPAKRCLEVIQSLEELTSHYMILKRTQLAIAQKYAAKDEKGEIIFNNGVVTFDDPAKESACKKEIAEIRSEYIDVPLSEKIKIYDDMLFTPKTLYLLEDVIDVVERSKSKEPASNQA